MNETQIRDTTDLDVDLETLEESAQRLKSRSISTATLRAYHTDWKKFLKFCIRKKLQSLPAAPETVSVYIAQLVAEKRSFSTISRALTSIGRIHQLTNHPSPVKCADISAIMSGTAREIGTRQAHSRPISYELWTKMLEGSGGTSVIDCRDRAIIAIGWAAALRRSEIANLNIEDVDFCREGMIVFVKKSKTDQVQNGYKISVPCNPDSRHCPVSLTRAWIERTCRKSGPLFFKIGPIGAHFYLYQTEQIRLTDKSIANVIKKTVMQAGENPSLYSAHSLRRGLATEAGKCRVPERIIQRHTRHDSLIVLRGYIEDGDTWNDNPLPAIWHEGNRHLVPSYGPPSPLHDEEQLDHLPKD